MIPQRIMLQGLLCYRERQEIHFDDAPLWMLAGLNGSGKSAVFDAVTYALFGGHRGGQRNADELINKESDGLLVELDFRLGDDTYRIKRTLKKQGRSTRQVLQRQPGVEEGKNAWKPIENTGNQRGFDEWVRDNIGLSYETFTSSVLLMQGRAEKLLNSDASDRRKVLAGIVDLERYEKLHKRADERRKHLKDRVEDLQQRLNVLSEVSELELEEAEARIADVQGALELARAEVERRQRLQVQGERWADLCNKRDEAIRQWEQAQGLLERAEAIERDWARLRLLRDVLPQLQTGLEQRQRLAESVANSAKLLQERKQFADQVTELEYAEKQARDKREVLQQTIAADQLREQEVGRRLQELSGVLTRVDLWEQQRQRVVALEAELAALPADPMTDLAREQEEADRLAAVGQALPFLERLREERDNLAQARGQVRQAQEEEDRLTAHGTQLAIDLRNMKQQVQAVVEARQRADDRVAETRALLNEARKELEELDKLQGARVCRHCGQALTREHLEAEKGRRARKRAEAEAESRRANEERQRAVVEEKRLLDQEKAGEDEIQRTRDQFRECKTRRKQAEQDVARSVRGCQRLYHDLAEPFRLRIAPALPEDWLATTYPDDGELAALRGELKGLGPARCRLQQARALMEQWSRLQAQRDTARRTLAAQEADLPGEVATLREEHGALQKEDSDLKRRLREQRARLREEQDGLESLGRERARVQQHLGDRERRLDVERVRQESCQETLARLRAALPAEWQESFDEVSAARLRTWETERTNLERQRAEERAQQLHKAREQLEALRQEKANRERELEEVPEEARCSPAELQEKLQAARQQQTAREEELDAARSARKALTDRRDERQRLHEQYLTLDQQYHRCRLLAELLGPKRMQLHLVREAERGIVDYANEVLDRLSGGQLYLRLRSEDSEEATEKALDLEAYNRAAGEMPIGVAFLSGSQRFRVAVSLALGIGQYASRQHRPIESVIIDEGFGCLDRQGRQVMIQELQNLREHMRCILLVSHQEEFAESFPNGYRFELTNGTTAVTRFQR